MVHPDVSTDPDVRVNPPSDPPRRKRSGRAIETTIALSLAAIAIAAIIAGVAGSWPPADVSRIVVICLGAMVGIRRSPGAGVTVAAASEAVGNIIGGGA